MDDNSLNTATRGEGHARSAVGQHELPLIDDEIAQIGHMTDPAVPLSCGTGGKLESGSVAVDGSGGIRG